METTIKHLNTHSFGETYHNLKTNWKKFINWSAGQEENRIMWTAISILGHGCVITIITILAIVYSGNHFIFWPFAIGAMSASVVSYLAALPTKVTIPIFFFSLLIDVLIIISCFINGFSDYSVFYR
ncbi:MAG: hypothetical protein JST17_10000 [Bacteroidetes bacterium]|nr:hypothetical protein [Bacteroidota bacterium]MBS1930040.1 hypothetical protein [Bacteroidota bacterium]